MAVADIKLISIVGLVEHFDQAVGVLGKSHVFHPDEVSDFYSSTKNFEHMPSGNVFADPLAELRNSLELAKFPLKYIDVDDFKISDEELISGSKKICSEIDLLINDVASAGMKLNDIKQDILRAKHFIGLNVKFDDLAKCKYIKSCFGRLPKESYGKLSNYDDNPFVNFFVCSEEENYYWGVYITPREYEDKIDRIFSGLYFEQCDISGLDATPKEYYDKLTKELPDYESRYNKAVDALNKYKQDNKLNILKYYSMLSQLSLFSTIKSKALTYHGKGFCIVGWIPKEYTEKLKGELEKIESVETEFVDGKDELKHSPPVRLKNNFFFRPFEFYTEMFGVPRYNEIDPTPFVAMTYVVLFGIMFADVGHGIVLSIAGLLMWKLKRMKIGKILVPCGITSAIFGCIFGSVFGFEHMLDPLYKALFGFEEKPIEVMAPSMTNYIIYFAVGIGIVLLIAAIIMGIYSKFKQKNPGEAIFGVNGICGLVFYTALVGGIVCQLLLGIPIMSVGYVLGLIVLPLILLYIREPLIKLVNGNKNWMPEKPGEFLVDNFFELFEVLLSYITNTMSFLRVGAFVLVHAGMMEVVFVMAEMSGGIGYWIIVVLGNFVVLGLEALLVAIQVLRLEYYEMFSRFYTGDGRPYEPVRLNDNNA